MSTSQPEQSIQPQPHYIYNVPRSTVDDRDIPFVAPESVAKAILPPKIDLRGKMPPVLSQGQIGSCVSNAASNSLRYLLTKEKRYIFQPSRLFIYWNTRVLIEGNPADQDTGISIRGVCKSLSKYSACTETIWPYDVTKYTINPPLQTYTNASLHSVVKYLSLQQDLFYIKQALVSGFPVMFGIQVYESFESDYTLQTGIITYPNVGTEQCFGGHAMLIVGYNDVSQRFILQNSWGTSVGQNGFFEIDYNYILNSDLTWDLWVLTFF
jgi:C1A family cysteine protease